MIFNFHLEWLEIESLHNWLPSINICSAYFNMNASPNNNLI